MARMTDIDELLEKVAKIQASGGSQEKRVGEIILAITNAPTVEVVRCKDCIHWYKPDDVCLKIYSDGAVSPYAWQVRNPDDFCSYGERKDDDI